MLRFPSSNKSLHLDSAHWLHPDSELILLGVVQGQLQDPGLALLATLLNDGNTGDSSVPSRWPGMTFIQHEIRNMVSVQFCTVTQI